MPVPVKTIVCAFPAAAGLPLSYTPVVKQYLLLWWHLPVSINGHITHDAFCQTIHTIPPYPGKDNHFSFSGLPGTRLFSDWYFKLFFCHINQCVQCLNLKL